MRNEVWVALAACAVFAVSLKGSFVNDDRPIILQNPVLRSGQPLAAVFARPYWNRGAGHEASGGLYRPLTILSYKLNLAAGGTNPFWFHLVNVLLHGLNSALVVVLAGRLGLAAPAALLAGLIFAVLPIHAEPVSWIVGRAELLAAAFALSSWILGLEKGRPRLAWALLLFALSLLAKESAAALPAVIVLCDAWKKRRRWEAWLLYAAVLLLYLIWRKSVLGSAFLVGAPYFNGQSFLTVLLTMAKFLALGWLWPMATGLGLTADYSRPSFPDAAYSDLLAWALAAAALGSIVLALRRRGPVSLGWLVLLGFAAPVSNLLVPMEIIGGERLMYVASTGFCLAAAVLLAKLPKPAVAAVLLWWASLAALRSSVWATDKSLWTAELARGSRSPRATVGLGAALAEEGRVDEALPLFHKALELDPRLPHAAYALGKAYETRGELVKAHEHMILAHRLSSFDPDTLCYLGVIDERLGRTDSALKNYRLALDYDPGHPLSHRNRGLLLYRLGRRGEAAEHLSAYLEAAPGDPEAPRLRALLAP